MPSGCQHFTQRWVHSIVLCMHRIHFHSHTHPHNSEARVTPVAPETLFKPHNWQSPVQKCKKITSLRLCCANHTPHQQYLLKTRQVQPMRAETDANLCHENTKLFLTALLLCLLHNAIQAIIAHNYTIGLHLQVWKKCISVEKPPALLFNWFVVLPLIKFVFKHIGTYLYCLNIF